jgi:hypothetical protein
MSRKILLPRPEVERELLDFQPPTTMNDAWFWCAPDSLVDFVVLRRNLENPTILRQPQGLRRSLRLVGSEATRFLTA